MEKQIPGIMRRSSLVSRLSMFTPLACTSRPMEWPVLWIKKSPYTCITDHLPNRVIHLPAMTGPSLCKPIMYKRDACISCIADNIENLDILFRRMLPCKSAPGDICPDRSIGIFTCPQIDQNRVPFLNRVCIVQCWLEMRIGRMIIHANDRKFAITIQSLLFKTPGARYFAKLPLSVWHVDLSHANVTL